MNLYAVKPMIRTNPLIAGEAASALVVGLIGICAVTGVIPGAMSQKPGDVTAEDRPAGGSARWPRPCANCGTIESIRTVELHSESSVLGAVTGGLAGGVLGNQMGRGRGRTAMTIIGTAGGALAGNEIGMDLKMHHAYRVTVHMDDGSFWTVLQASPPAFAVGDKVRVIDGTLARA